MRVLVEAMLDFPEEEVDVLDTRQRDIQLSALETDTREILNLAQQGSLLREGVHIVLAGQPNAGKSSLLNRLSGEEVALVSDIPGTTRDVIRQTIQLKGIPLHLVDTAGLRDAQDQIEQMGIDRAHQTLQKADIILLLTDVNNSSDAEDRKILDRLPVNIPAIRIFNKIDVAGHAPQVKESPTECSIYLSAKTGAGLDLLYNKMLSLVGWQRETGVFMARERHIQALLKAGGHLRDAKTVTNQTELVAEELRLAQEALNTITGEFTSDDLLGEIFGNFCIGK